MADEPTPTGDTIRLARTNWWTQLPDQLAFDPDLTVAALRCYAYLQGEAARSNEPVGCTQDTIAEACGLSPRSMARPLKWLEDKGWIDRTVVRFGPVTLRTDYVVYVDSPRAGSARMDRADERGVQRADERDDCSIQTSLEVNTLPRAEPARHTAALDAEFETWWKAYPRKKAKPNARKAWTKARSKASVQVLTDGLDLLDRSNPKFIPHGATWLNGERWNDEPDRSRGGPGDHVATDIEPGRITDL